MKGTSSCLVLAGLLTAFGAQAQTSDNFNSRNGIAASQVKGYLQSNCWIFDGFDVNQGWTPAIEGDGAMVSAPGATDKQKNGIYSPLLNSATAVAVAFSYKMDHALAADSRRWIRFYLTDADRNIIGPCMDSVEITHKTANTVYSFNKKFQPVGTAPYRVYINYQGTGGNTHLAIDQLTISAPLYYPGGCNSAPVAVNDNINGAANHSAAGQVITNDTEPNHEHMKAYLVQNSKDGEVALNTDGSFTFTPKAGFTGSTTTFKYKLCDDSNSPLCSNDATVTIAFAKAAGLVNFKGLYKDAGDVELSWATGSEQNSDRFEVERSLDGTEWKTVGTVKAKGTSDEKVSYAFLDNVGRNTASKKDIYYRLRQIDQASKATLTKMLIVRVYNTRSLKMVSVSPDPAKNDIAVNVQLNEQSMIVMKVVKAGGEEVMRKSIKAEAGDNSYLMDGTRNLTPGNYALELTVNSKERMIVGLVKE